MKNFPRLLDNISSRYDLEENQLLREYVAALRKNLLLAEKSLMRRDLYDVNGIITVAGGSGAGKTSLIAWMLSTFFDRSQILWIGNDMTPTAYASRMERCGGFSGEAPKILKYFGMREALKVIEHHPDHDIIVIDDVIDRAGMNEFGSSYYEYLHYGQRRIFLTAQTTKESARPLHGMKSLTQLLLSKLAYQVNLRSSDDSVSEILTIKNRQSDSSFNTFIEIPRLINEMLAPPKEVVNP